MTFNLITTFLPISILFSTTFRLIGVESASDNGCLEIFQSPSCQCLPSPSPTEIECVDSDFQDNEYLNSVGNVHFTNWRSVTFRGNRFEHLPGYIFGVPSSPHQYANLETIDLSSNSIENISNDAFCSMPKVKKLDLSNNKLILGDLESTLFNSMSSLKELHLKNSFDQPLNSFVQMTHLQRIFKNAKFRHLYLLDLSSNSLEFLPFDFLCTLKQLTTLYLSENLFTTLNLNVECLANLKVLDLSRNKFAVLDPDFIHTMTGLKADYSVKLFGNPFECNCNATTYLDWIYQSTLIFDKHNLTCYKASPKQFVGKLIYADIMPSAHDLDCQQMYTDDQQPVGSSDRSQFCYGLLIAITWNLIV